MNPSEETTFFDLLETLPQTIREGDLAQRLGKQVQHAKQNTAA